MKHKGLKYEELLDSLMDRGFYSTPGHSGVFLRHDVDVRMDAAYNMAMIEYKRGIKACYFLLHPVGKEGSYWYDPSTWNMAKEMEEMGHEIGFHNSVVVDSLITGIPCKELLNTYLNDMRRHGLKVVGTSEHGHPLCYEYKVRNRQVWDMYSELPNIPQCSLQEFGLKWDCSQVNALKKAEQYGLEKDGDHDELFLMDCGKGWYGMELQEVLSSDKQSKIHINIHPNRWQK